MYVASVHEGKKPFNCEICDASFTAKQRMRSHYEAVHEGKNLTNVIFVLPALHKKTT